MWVYRQCHGIHVSCASDNWEVGFYTPGGVWYSIGIFTEETARQEVHYLNRGN